MRKWLLLLILFSVNVDAKQICDCHVMCEALSDPQAYIGKNRSLATLKLADMGYMYRSQVDFGEGQPFDPKGYQEFLDLLDYLQQMEINVAIVNLPPRPLFNRDGFSFNEIHKALNSFLRQQRVWQAHGAVVPDWIQLVNQKRKTPFYFYRDTHWKPEGARSVANALADSLDWRGNHTFETIRGGIARHNGNMQRLTESLCTVKFPAEYYRQYTTTGVGGVNAGVEEVLLVGSSNSDSKFNFSGFLAQALSARVRTLFDKNALLPELSGTTKEQLPKWIVFEIPAEETFKSSSIYARMLRNQETSCDSPVLYGVGKPGSMNPDVLVNKNSLQMNPATHYLNVSSDEVTDILGKLVLWYSGGRSKEVKLNSKSSRGITIELPDHDDWETRQFVALDYYPEGSSELPVEIELCEIL